MKIETRNSPSMRLKNWVQTKTKYSHESFSLVVERKCPIMLMNNHDLPEDIISSQKIELGLGLAYWTPKYFDGEDVEIQKTMYCNPHRISLGYPETECQSHQ